MFQCSKHFFCFGHFLASSQCLGSGFARGFPHALCGIMMMIISTDTTITTIIMTSDMDMDPVGIGPIGTIVTMRVIKVTNTQSNQMPPARMPRHRRSRSQKQNRGLTVTARPPRREPKMWRKHRPRPDPQGSLPVVLEDQDIFIVDLKVCFFVQRWCQRWQFGNGKKSNLYKTSSWREYSVGIRWHNLHFAQDIFFTANPGGTFWLEVLWYNEKSYGTTLKSLRVVP